MELPGRRPGQVVVGFAAETKELVETARRKLAAKKLDLIVANDVTEPGAGFGTDTNRVVLIDRRGQVGNLPLMPKRQVAHCVLDAVQCLTEGHDQKNRLNPRLVSSTQALGHKSERNSKAR
jgi:phosphopantothenoylcysteine decarboxylase/phosphopantothenate--cysteine ligase